MLIIENGAFVFRRKMQLTQLLQCTTGSYASTTQQSQISIQRFKSIPMECLDSFLPNEVVTNILRIKKEKNPVQSFYFLNR